MSDNKTNTPNTREAGSKPKVGRPPSISERGLTQADKITPRVPPELREVARELGGRGGIHEGVRTALRIAAAAEGLDMGEMRRRAAARPEPGNVISAAETVAPKPDTAKPEGDGGGGRPETCRAQATDKKHTRKKT